LAGKGLIAQPIRKEVDYNVDTYSTDPEIPPHESDDERHTSEYIPVLYEV